MSRSPLVLFVFLVLLALHQDVWFWDDDKTLILGFLPVGLAYHAFYTVVVAVFWGLVIKFAWPKELEALAGESPETEAKD